MLADNPARVLALTATPPARPARRSARRDAPRTGALSPRGACGSGTPRRSARSAAPVARQQRHQPPGANVVGADEVWLERDPGTGGRERDVEVPAVGLRPPADADRVLAAVGAMEAPLPARQDVLVDEAVVPQQVFRRRGRPVPRQVLRRGARDEPHLAELARDEVLRTCAADADREVEALFDEVDHPVGELDVELHVGVTREEPGDRRGDVSRAEGHGGREPDRAAGRDRRLRRFLLGFLQVLQQLHRSAVERLAALGEAQPARRAVEEPGPKVCFELCDLARYRRGRQAEPFGRA